MSDPTMPGSPPPMPPPGWYRDPAGAMRWWDGGAWGPAAPQQGGIDDRTIALLAQLSAYVSAPIGALLCYLLTKPDRTFARDHSREALNFQITFLLGFVVAWFGWMILILVLAAASAPNDGELGAAGAIFFVVTGILGVGWFLYGMIAPIIGAVRAWQERPFRYPISIRFVRPSATERAHQVTPR
jgi:uncharacterized Tic20 family protein